MNRQNTMQHAGTLWCCMSFALPAAANSPLQHFCAAHMTRRTNYAVLCMTRFTCLSISSTHPIIPSSFNVALSSLSQPSTSFETKQETDVDEGQEDLLTSSLSTSVLSILQHHQHHPINLPSGHFSNNTPVTGPNISELWLTGRGNQKLMCWISSALVEQHPEADAVNPVLAGW